MMAPEKKAAPGFVDRESELETLKALFREASGGRGVVVFVSGEAGIGKSRLVAEFEGFVASQGAEFLRGRGL